MRTLGMSHERKSILYVFKTLGTEHNKIHGLNNDHTKIYLHEGGLTEYLSLKVPTQVPPTCGGYSSYWGLGGEDQGQEWQGGGGGEWGDPHVGVGTSHHLAPWRRYFEKEEEWGKGVVCGVDT